MKTPASRKESEDLDARDPLRGLRDYFELPDGIIYLDGNSLGPPPKEALTRLAKAAQEEWGNGLIGSWNDAGWIKLPESCGAKIAKLIGAENDEVIVADSVTVNLFKLAAALNEKRKGSIAVEKDEFPTDGYIAGGLSRLTETCLVKIQGDDPSALAGNDISVFVKSVVHYKTAAIADIAAWENEAQKNNVAIIWDLSHAAGVIELDLKKSGAKYAVGCGYKFLNGGPGAPAFLYVDRNVVNDLNQPLTGWMGHASPFDFSGNYHPAPGIRRFSCGTPQILSLSALDGALELFQNIDMGKVEEKARGLGDLFLSRAKAMGLSSVSPAAGERRGAHVGLSFEHGYEVVQALIARGIIGDFRAPDLMRFGFSPFYLRYADVWDAADQLEDILKTEAYRDPAFAVRKHVT
jgi:kynureninase